MLFRFRTIWGLTALSLVITLNGCNQASQTNNGINTKLSSASGAATTLEEHPLVVATDTIVCGLTQKIAVDTVNLKCLTTPESESDSKQPKPEALKVIEQAKLILYSSNNLAPSLSKLIQSTPNPAPKIAVDEVAAPNALQSQGDGTVNPPDVMPKAEAIGSSLSQLQPTKTDFYKANAQKITNELTQINSWSQSEIATLPVEQRKLINTKELLAYLNPSLMPEINKKARLARVPIFMYHDILPKKQVFFDVTPEVFERHLRLLQANNITPISLEQLVIHLRTGLPLPKKPILLTFDDGYGGHYQYVYPLLKKYGYPAVFSIYTSNVGKDTGRTHVTWEQLKEMLSDPLVTIASHSVTHPLDMRTLTDQQLQMEVMESKRILESQLGIHIRYFTYPSGNYNMRVTKLVQQAGYEAALTMNDLEDRFAGQSKNLLTIDRIGQSKLPDIIERAWGGSLLVK